MEGQGSNNTTVKRELVIPLYKRCIAQAVTRNKSQEIELWSPINSTYSWSDPPRPTSPIKYVLVYTSIVSRLESRPQVVRPSFRQSRDRHISGERHELLSGRRIVPEEIPCCRRRMPRKSQERDEKGRQKHFVAVSYPVCALNIIKKDLRLTTSKILKSLDKRQDL